MDKFLEAIMSSPWFCFLFGGGGVLAGVLAIVQLLKRKKGPGPTTPDIEVNINIDKPQDLGVSNHSQKIPVIVNKDLTNKASYENCNFGSDDFYIKFLAEVEKKKKGRDDISYD